MPRWRKCGGRVWLVAGVFAWCAAVRFSPGSAWGFSSRPGPPPLGLGLESGEGVFVLGGGETRPAGGGRIGGLRCAHGRRGALVARKVLGAGEEGGGGGRRRVGVAAAKNATVRGRSRLFQRVCALFSVLAAHLLLSFVKAVAIAMQAPLSLFAFVVGFWWRDRWVKGEKKSMVLETRRLQKKKSYQQR
jgi:hypothetical protein